MLHKSFKPAKCKTALKMASARIKLLKNKREAHLTQLKRELAQLLESGQDPTARIRVEHVVREEKTLAAYDLIDIYSELIVARLPIIESQKTCPIDLKEAIASVIFASPRCADIPELMDVRKSFTAKYGKEFVSAAVELRPDCGVSRLLVEKLSAKAPDGPTKMKILSAIAEEHNIKWEPKSFGEKDTNSPEDLLNGPKTFEQASKLHMETPIVQEPPDGTVRRPYDFQVPPKHNERYYGPSSGSSLHLQNLHSTNVGNRTMPTGISHPDPGPLGTEAEGMEFRHPYNGDRGDFSMGRPSWNMEFKDATAAAQAAAESAERASMAARAAAELSSQGRISRQHSNKLKKSFASGSRDEEFQNYTDSKMHGEHVAKGHMTDEQNDGNEQDDLAGLAERFKNLKTSNKSSGSASSKSSSASVNDYHCVNDKHMADRHSRKSSSELENDFLGEVSAKRESSELEVDFESRVPDGTKSETIGHFEEINMTKQCSSVSSHSHSETHPNDNNVVSSFDSQKPVEGADENPFFVDEVNIERMAKETTSYNNASVVFDDSGSDDDEYKFGMEYKSSGRESSSYFSSEGRESYSHLVANTNAWSLWRNVDESSRKSNSQSIFAPEQQSATTFSEDSRGDAVPSLPDDVVAATFDESESPSSESEEELDKSMPVQSASFAPENEEMRSNNGTVLQPSILDSDGAVHTKRNQDIATSGGPDRDLGYSDMHARQPSSRLLKSCSNISCSISEFQSSGHSSVNIQTKQSQDIIEDATPLDESTLEGGNGLNFGILTGGLRNKGYRYPPYRRNPSGNSSLSKRTVEGTSTQVEQFSHKDGIYSGARGEGLLQSKVHKKTASRTSVTYSDSSDDDSDEKHPQETISNSQEPHDKKEYSDANKKSSSMAYFDMDNSESDEDLPKQTSTGKGRSVTGFSRRTKGLSTNSGRNSYSKASILSDPSETPDNVMERKSSFTIRGATESEPKPVSQMKSSNYSASSEQRRKIASKPTEQSQRISREESSTRSSYATETQQNLKSQSKSSDYGGSTEHRRSAEKAVSNPISESKRSFHKESLKSSSREQLSNPPREQPSNPPKTVTSGTAKSLKTSSSSGEAPSRENSINRASHVHPKLPDYDTFAATLLSLRQNRQ